MERDDRDRLAKVIENHPSTVDWEDPEAVVDGKLLQLAVTVLQQVAAVFPGEPLGTATASLAGPLSECVPKETITRFERAMDARRPR